MVVDDGDDICNHILTTVIVSKAFLFGGYVGVRSFFGMRERCLVVSIVQYFIYRCADSTTSTWAWDEE